MIHIPTIDLSILDIPKNGGTTLWTWAYWLRRGGFPKGGNVYGESWLSKGDRQARALMVRRDQVDRFIYGYRNFRDKRGLRLGFVEFVERFDDLYQSDEDTRWHFRPQSRYYPEIPLAKIDHVVDFDDFASAKLLLENLSGQKIPDLHLQRAVFDDFEVDEALAAMIAESYRCDYEAGFGVWDSWRSRVS